ncbi:hypothetical protein BURPS1106B_0206 [Burkholderia pseudomallei 1106b]|nr:hypothetical protein BURPS1106B_0206 [Burkholderia pseudomallei 1106b]
MPIAPRAANAVTTRPHGCARRAGCRRYGNMSRDIRPA